MKNSEYRILLVDAPERLSLWFDGTIPSPALSILASYVKTRYELKVLDLNIEERPWEVLKKALDEFKPHLVGLSCTHTCQMNEVMAAARLVRKFSPSSLIAGGGIYFSVFYEESINAGSIDIAAIGEGELTFSALVKALSAIESERLRGVPVTHPEMSRRLQTIDGIAFKNEAGAIIKTAPRKYIENLDSIPFPSYELYPIDKYRSPTFGGGDAFGMTFSRGCANRCYFCSESAGWNHTLRRHSPEYAVRHLEIIYRNYGRKVFVFGDTDFLSDKKWCEGFIALIKTKKIAINFHVQASCNSVIKNEELLPKLKKIGLFEVMIGAESPFQKILSKLKKPYSDKETVVGAMERVKKHGLLLMAMLLWGTEFDDESTLHEGLYFFDKYADIVCPCLLTPYPGTALYDEMKAKGLVKVEDFAFYDQAHVIVPAGTMSYKETRWIYEKELCRYFNLNPKFYMKLLSKDPFMRMNQMAFFKMVWARTFECVTSQGGYKKDLFNNGEYLKLMNMR